MSAFKGYTFHTLAILCHFYRQQVLGSNCFSLPLSFSFSRRISQGKISRDAIDGCCISLSKQKEKNRFTTKNVCVMDLSVRQKEDAVFTEKGRNSQESFTSLLSLSLCSKSCLSICLMSLEHFSCLSLFLICLLEMTFTSFY